jgi:hypothetical protein
VKSAFSPSCYNEIKKSTEMPSIRTASINFILFIPLLAVQHAAAQDSSVTDRDVAGRPAVAFVDTANYELIESADEDIQQLFSLYMDARTAGMMQEADVLAKQIVEKSIRSFGRDSKDTARALTSLATLQTSNHENIAAIQNFAAAIDIIEFMDGRLSMDLHNPLKAMGAAQLQAGNGDHARDAWIRAVHISHVNLGPHNLEQIETLYAIAALYSRAEMSKEERIVRRQIKYLQYRYSASERQEIVPAMNEQTEGMIPISSVASGSE